MSRIRRAVFLGNFYESTARQEENLCCEKQTCSHTTRHGTEAVRCKELLIKVQDTAAHTNPPLPDCKQWHHSSQDMAPNLSRKPPINGLTLSTSNGIILPRTWALQRGVGKCCKSLRGRGPVVARKFPNERSYSESAHDSWGRTKKCLDILKPHTTAKWASLLFDAKRPHARRATSTAQQDRQKDRERRTDTHTHRHKRTHTPTDSQLGLVIGQSFFIFVFLIWFTVNQIRKTKMKKDCPMTKPSCESVCTHTHTLQTCLGIKQHTRTPTNRHTRTHRLTTWLGHWAILLNLGLSDLVLCEPTRKKNIKKDCPMTKPIWGSSFC